MRYHALAADYDGTLATRGRIDEPTLAALRRLRASGRKLVLVTGRRVEDLESVCPETALFDRIVAENGAVLHQPSTGETRALAAPPPPALLQALQARGVSATVGRVIVATTAPHETAVREALRQLGLAHQLIYNKGALMLLPPAIDKASGLAAALAELGISPQDLAGVGDAENDLPLLASCAYAVAVANALPSLKQRADLVTTSANGAGVSEFIDTLLATDLPSPSQDLPEP